MSVPTEDVESEDQRVASPPPAVQGPGANWIGAKLGDRFVVRECFKTDATLWRFVAVDEVKGGAVWVCVPSLPQISEGLMRRFQRRAELAQSIEHEHVTRTLAHGQFDGRPYVCVERIAGTPITTWLDRGVFNVSRIAQPICELLSALSEAHRRGLVHGSLSHDSALVHELAPNVASLALCDLGVWRSPHADFVAPEQLSGQSDGCVDVYATGALLYLLLTGVSPRAREATADDGSILRPSAVRRDSALPVELENLCMRALEESPQKRFGSPTQMATALRRLIETMGPKADIPITVSGRPQAHTNESSLDRPTLPGEQLRSSQKVLVGSVAVAAMCGAVWFLLPSRDDAVDQHEAASRFGTAPASAPIDDESEGITQVVARARSRIARGEIDEAISDLRLAREELGDAPEILVALAQALMKSERSAEARPLLERALAGELSEEDRRRAQELLADL